MLVYLVENSEILGRLLVQMLECEQGVETAGLADNATQAIADMAQLKPDVAVVDLQLRSGHGFDVLKAIQALPAERRPIAMVLTNFASAPVRAAAQRLGARYFFDKSSDILMMLKTLSAMASRTHLVERRDDPIPMRSPIAAPLKTAFR